jgi:hypothetical protein
MAMLYDIYCSVCGKEIIDYWKEDSLFPECCGKEMRPLIRCKSFELKYNSKTDMCTWGDQGYSSSMYWKAVKEARERGENVKGATEN